MTTTRWGIIGPGSIAANFATGLGEAESGTLAAIASRSAERRAAFGERFGVPQEGRLDDYAALAASDAVDAIHIATPHPFHAEQALMAIRAGKPVSVEKPAGLNEAEVTALVEAARQEGVLFAEAYMYLHHPQIAKMLEILRSGRLGKVRHVRAVFGFAAPVNPEGRLYARDLAGGGILDVGGYPVSAARLIAGAAEGAWADPVEVKGVGRIGTTGVDESARAVLRFADGVTADVACAVAEDMGQRIDVMCEGGTLTLPNPWIPGRAEGPSDTVILVEQDGTVEEIPVQDPRMLFTFEAEALSRAVAEGRTSMDWPAMTPEGSIGNARVLDAWRAQVGYRTFAEEPGLVRTLPGVLPAGLPRVPTTDVGGVTLNKLVLGCDNRETPAEGAIMWDAWWELGGTSFDTGFVYGAGRHEAVLGQWLRSRGVAQEATVIVKGAHSPYCVPDAIGVQLAMSLDRLGLERAPIYIMHRDNPDVPVGEFVEAIAALQGQGRIGRVWGGSNWTPARFAEAMDYAQAHGHTPPSILNNNLSLAVMEKPVWPGCVTSNTPEMLSFLRGRGIAHVSWSSQARGYFLPAELRDRLPEDTRPETCFGSTANAERRRRAEELAQRKGVSAHNIATAWVLGQSFPSVALIGPRSPGEIVSTLPGLSVELTPDEVLWLNLED
ncbi:aldo/keto reductase [Wenxinia saemankumensis]|uniref:Predicted dehydrogenase n=1 Tax=Wenxinia saemankumensis TaxID=1447782 RepID=A0A1M6AP04_9RHOB|nr:aldo/keto reductase [Wenxinia saemankumensis]SHI37933.1 Predicted dehydrogenase [Wenxinia saemankumensis]